MESLKDVIVSQPPAMYTSPAAAAPSSSSAAAWSQPAQSISLENYKGILLCDRPVASMYGGNSTGYGDGASATRPFVPANRTGNPLGAAPSMEARAQHEQHQRLRAENSKCHRERTRQALSRHRRWLHSFAQQVRRMRGDEREREVAAARQAARLRAAELQRIADSKKNNSSDDNNDDNDDNNKRAAMTTTAPPPPPATAAAADYDVAAAVPAATQRRASAAAPAAPAAAAARGGKATKSRKPTWAMTEDEALDAELTQHDDLLAFAEQLDYERFVTDCEVAEALSAMRDRVHAIARANDWSDDDIRRAASRQAATDRHRQQRRRRNDNNNDNDNDDDDSDETRSVTSTCALRRDTASEDGGVSHTRHATATTTTTAAAAAAAHAHEWDSSTRCGRVLRRAISDDALALAERLLHASPSLQRVYTRQSLARVVQQCALRGNTTLPADVVAAAADANAVSNNSDNNNGGDDKDASGMRAVLVGPLTPAQPRIVAVSSGAMATSNDAATATATATPAAPQRILCALQRSTERTQGLPYLYRCPAI